MTDMRATERLLEVIDQAVSGYELACKRGEDFILYDDLFTTIIDAIRELRKRGDTLVRADDLRWAVDYANDENVPWADQGLERHRAAINRLEEALGGKLQ